jgi:hypothetical protein
LAQALATRLHRIHKDEPDISFLIHIDGPWGIGKSTLLNFLRTELQQDWVTIEFNAWRQAHVGPAWWALLVTLRHGIQRSLSRLARVRLRITESWFRLRRGGAPFVLAATLLLVAVATALLLLHPSALALKSAGSLAGAAAAVGTAIATLWAGFLVAGRFLLWDSARGARLFEQSSTDPMQSVSDHFGWLVARARNPVIFFIDDLDRCPQSYVVEFLEAVQTLLRDATEESASKSSSSSAPCFVVAADGAWIRKSYEIAYDQFSQAIAEPGRPLGYLFLDKLFQLRVPVPIIDTTRQEDYLREMLSVRSPNQTNRQVAAEEQAVRKNLQNSESEADIIETLRGASSQVRHRVASAAVERLTTPEVATTTEHSLQKFGPLLTPNPRSMKRFVNAYSVLRAVRTLEGNPVPSEPLALWTIIETRWPRLADYLRTKPEAIELLGKAVNELESVPEDLQSLFASPVVYRLATFKHGGPLTPVIISACCGAGESSDDEADQSEPPVEQQKQGPTSGSEQPPQRARND